MEGAPKNRREELLDSALEEVSSLAAHFNAWRAYEIKIGRSLTMRELAATQESELLVALSKRRVKAIKDFLAEYKLRLGMNDTDFSTYITDDSIEVEK